MRFRNLVTVFISFFAVTVRGDPVSISINPIFVREFRNKYNITCQYPNPAARNTSTTGVLRITHLTNSEVIYSFDFDASQETISSAMKIRSTPYLNQTTTTIILQVNVALATDAGFYNCSLTDATSASYATTSAPLNVTGCSNGTLVSYLSQCSSLHTGDPCSIVCSSSDANGMVSLSRNYDGSSPLISNTSGIKYTIASVGDADYGAYYCYVITAACTSMGETSMTQASVATTPAKATNGTDCGSGCRSRIPGWGIALIVIACVLVVVIIVLLVLYLLNKKGFFQQKVCCLHSEGEVQPDSRGQTRSVANDNFAMSKSTSKNNDAGEKNGKGKKDKSINGNNAQPVNFPEVKTRKNTLPPLAAAGTNRASENNDHSPDGPSSGRALPKRKPSTTDDNHSPDGRRRNSLGRRESIDDGSPARGNKLPPIRAPRRDYDDEDNDRF